MKKHQIDHILSKMLDFSKNVSDLNLTPGKPLQVESSGQLIPVKIEPSPGFFAHGRGAKRDHFCHRSHRIR
jgi:hypothetical protein